MASSEEIYSTLRKSFATFLQGKVESLQTNLEELVRTGQPVNPELLEGFGAVELPEELSAYFDDYHKKLVTPYINIQRDAILHAVAEYLSDSRPLLD